MDGYWSEYLLIFASSYGSLVQYEMSLNKGLGSTRAG